MAIKMNKERMYETAGVFIGHLLFYYYIKMKQIINETEETTMAMYDWNHNGKKDMADDFIEYQIYKDVTGQDDESSYTPRRGGSGGGISSFGAIISVIAGFVMQVILYMLLGIDVENVPVFVIVILWAVFSAIAAVVIEGLES